MRHLDNDEWIWVVTSHYNKNVMYQTDKPREQVRHCDNILGAFFHVIYELEHPDRLEKIEISKQNLSEIRKRFSQKD